jgi:Sulfotransferase family
MLDAAAIVAQAEARVGIGDSEARYYQPNLQKLVASINAEANLSPQGEAMVGAALLERTACRLEGLKWLRDFPAIGEEAIVAPVFLTGLPRSGTTFFQYLFDRDPRFRLIRTWEAVEPFPPPGHDPQSALRRKAEEAARRQRLGHLVKGFEAMHLSDADGPEECHAFMEQACAAAGFHNLLNVPGYFDYLVNGLDFAAAYRLHKRQLQLLQWRMPQPRWALKYPNHVLAMDVILDVYPDARFVMTHRDPVQTLASISKLTLKLREARSIGPVDPHRVGEQMLDFVRRHIDRIMAFADTDAGRRVCHVDYYRLVDDPAAVMTQVHAALDIDTPQAVREAVADWHRRNPRGARGSNPYALEDFGLDADAVAERFADYMRRFDIPRERDGLTPIPAPRVPRRP